MTASRFHSGLAMMRRTASQRRLRSAVENSDFETIVPGALVSAPSTVVVDAPSKCAIGTPMPIAAISRNAVRREIFMGLRFIEFLTAIFTRHPVLTIGHYHVAVIDAFNLSLSSHGASTGSTNSAERI